MKKIFQLALATLVTCIASSTLGGVNLNDHGLYFGRLNHLPDQMAFYQAKQHAQYVVFKFSANWCGPCQQLTTTLNQLAAKFENILFVEVEIDKFSTLKNNYNIRRIPTVILFKDGVQVHRSTGAQTPTYWVDVMQNSFDL